MPSEIQTIIFRKKYWRKSEAIDWIKARGYKHDMDETFKTYRFRQHDPRLYIQFITKKEDNGITFVIGYRWSPGEILGDHIQF